uniref:Uncharacterized protein n=2 Tax=Ciona intestinalis TaxID=7719 RepID=H2XSZ9_CIOIN
MDGSSNPPKKSRINKVAFINVVQHVEVHNRMQEEQEMWLKRNKDQHPRKRSRSPGEPKKKKRKKSKERKRSKKDESKTPPQPTERWGHSGFNELYPEDLISGRFIRSSDESEEEGKKKKKRSKKSKKKSKR